ncbi:MAG: gliding motility-associated C-terminal domain-containing protein [Bacteroidota bacterium]|nr:gliding motility-associated C-terminal domain-containing protein [Bacteroidota bacterium]
MNNKDIRYLFVFLVVIMCSGLQALHAQHNFIENKNQYPDQVEYKCRLNYGALFLEKDALVYNFADKSQYQHSHAHHGEGDVTHAHHEQDKRSETSPTVFDYHAYKVHFIDHNKDVKVSGRSMMPDYNNYFIGNDRSKWASHVRKYREAMYQDLYPGIDMLFLDEGRGLKYEFHVLPGANPSDVVMEYEGVDKIRIKKGNLQLKTSLSTTTELAPYAYQFIDGDTLEVVCEYWLEGNKLSYVFPDGYHKSHELIIDPSLVFSTYTGSTGDNWGFTATWDHEDNVYSGGIVFDVGYPTTIGAYQVDMAGGVPYSSNYYSMGCDVGVIKYTEDGSERLFATYLGGATGEEMPHSLMVNEFNELIIFGTTGSSDFPVSANGWDTQFNGGESITYDNVILFPDGTDIFLAKLSSDGSDLLGGTYLGGSENDGLNFKPEYGASNYIQMHGNNGLYYNYGDGARGEVIMDDKNMIYVGANTFSSDVGAGLTQGFQQSNAGGMDGLVAKFNADLSQAVWVSYHGGTNDDAIYSIYPDENGNIFVCGGTTSPDFPVSSQAPEPYYIGGTVDAFVSKINSTGTDVTGSTFFGSAEYDQAHFVRIDEDNAVHIYGQTKASGNTLVYNAGYSVPNSGQFLAKFNNDLTTLEWSTVIGRGAGEPVLSPSAFAVDVCDRIYLAGWGRFWPNHYLNEAGDTYAWTDNFGTKGLPVTADAIQTETDGQDFYVMVLSEDAAGLEYASFFGEVHYPACGYSGHDHVDGGTSRFDKKGNIIQSVCASCGGCQEFPTIPDPGVWSVTNMSTNCNNAVFKINIIENLAASSFDPIPAICAPEDVQFENNSQGSSFLWDFGDGSPTSPEFEPVHTYDQEGFYDVMLIAYDSLACNYSDTSSQEVEVQIPEVITLPPDTICPGESVQIGPEGPYDDDVVFEWISGENISNPNILNPNASPDNDSEYILLAHDICTDTIKQEIFIHDIDFDVVMPDDEVICEGDQVTLEADVSPNDLDMTWSDTPDMSNVISTGEVMTDYPDGNTVYYFEVTENMCNTSENYSVQVLMHEFNLSHSAPPVICYGDDAQITINNLNPDDILSYQWSPGNEIDEGQGTATVTVSPESNQTYTVSLTNQIGCETTEEISINVDDLQLLDPLLETPLCYGDCNGSATVSANGYPPYNYTWSTGESGEVVENLCAGSYVVTVVDEIGCEDVMNIQIDQPPPIDAQLVSVVQPECDGIGLGSAEINADGGVGGFSYHWSDGQVTAVNDELQTGENFVTITDANGCDTVLSVEMLPPHDLATQVDVEHNPCNGDCTGHATVVVTGGTVPYNYSWSNGDTGPNINHLCAGVYQATIIDAENCVIHQNININQPPPLMSNIHVDEPILCYGETGNLLANASGGTAPYEFTWAQGSEQQAIDSMPAGEYFLTVTDQHNCVDSTSVMLTEPPELKHSDTVINTVCSGVCNGKVYVEPEGGTPPYDFLWNSISGDSVKSGLCPGTYELVLKDANNCKIYNVYEVQQGDYIPELDVGADPIELYRGMSTRLAATNNPGYQYNWSPGAELSDDNQPVVTSTPDETTTYEIRIVDSLGCVNKDTITVIVNEVICGEPYLYIPNAFTPNGDGENDYFKPHAPTGVITDMYFAVYDRWGELLYESENINDRGWDGTYKGKVLPPDVYVYYFNATCLDQDTFTKKGNVTLIR